ncbi:MAG: nucleotide exchange factor GrpE [Actinomycetota bacterium]
MTEDRGRRPVKVKVMDKRQTSGKAAAATAAPPDADDDMVDTKDDEMAQTQEAQEAQDFLEDLRRLQAEFDNYRKRVLREQTAMANRASARLVERLLPVLDNFERAIEHGEGGPGIELVVKELRQVLENEGLEEIEADGAAFDPRVHEAFQAIDDPSVTEPIVHTVYRRGYRLGDAILRPAMVVVARPEDADEGRQIADEEETEG